MKKLFYLLLITGMFTSCRFAYEKHITGNFYLIAVDDIDQLMLCYSPRSESFYGIVGGGVFELSLNDKYFVVKRHPYINDTIRRLALDKVECYILEISNEDQFYDESKCHGPYSEKELAAKMREMNIDNVELFYERRR